MKICNGLLYQKQSSFSGLRFELAYETITSIDRFSTNRRTSLARRLLHGPFQKTPLYRTRRDAPNPRKYVFRHPTVIRAGDVEHIRTCEQ